MRLTLPVSLHSAGLNETVARLRERINTTSEEAVTGQYKDLTAHLSGRIGKAMLSQKAIDDVDNELSQLTLKSSRLDVIQSSLTGLNDTIDQLGVRMQAATGTGDHTAREAVVRDAKASLQQASTDLAASFPIPHRVPDRSTPSQIPAGLPSARRAVSPY